MLFYEVSVSQSKMHMFLRSEAGTISERMTCIGADWDGICSTGRDGVFSTVEAHDEISMIHSGLLYSSGSLSVSGSWHVADGVAFRRSTHIVK